MDASKNAYDVKTEQDTRHTYAAAILCLQVEDSDWHTTWDDLQKWWYELAADEEED